MPLPLADYANEGPPSAKLGPVSGYLAPVIPVAPIDMYLRGMREILAYGTSANLTPNPFLGRLLLLGIVSAAEGYTRSVLAATIELCPLARASAAKKAANLGGILWHGKDGYSRSAFENLSFASKEELTRAFKDYVGLSLDDVVFKSILDEYDNVCHLRHGIVHGDGFLPGKNAVQLDIPTYNSPVRIVIDYAHLQEVASVVNTLVFSLNRTLFEKMCERWAIAWRRRADWEPNNEVRLFRKVWSVFHSEENRRVRSGRSKLTCSKCIADVQQQFGL